MGVSGVSGWIGVVAAGKGMVEAVVGALECEGVRGGVAVGVTGFSYRVCLALELLVYLRLVVEVGDFPPAGGRPRFGCSGRSGFRSGAG